MRKAPETHTVSGANGSSAVPPWLRPTLREASLSGSNKPKACNGAAGPPYLHMREYSCICVHGADSGSSVFPVPRYRLAAAAGSLKRSGREIIPSSSFCGVGLSSIVTGRRGPCQWSFFQKKVASSAPPFGRPAGFRPLFPRSFSDSASFRPRLFPTASPGFPSLSPFHASLLSLSAAPFRNRLPAPCPASLSPFPLFPLPAFCPRPSPRRDTNRVSAQKHPLPAPPVHAPLCPCLFPGLRPFRVSPARL